MCQCSSGIWRIHLSDCLLSHDLSPFCTHSTDFHISGRVKYFFAIKTLKVYYKTFSGHLLAMSGLRHSHKAQVLKNSIFKQQSNLNSFSCILSHCIPQEAPWINSSLWSFHFSMYHCHACALRWDYIANTGATTTCNFLPTCLRTEHSVSPWLGQRHVSFVKSLSTPVLKRKRWKREGGLELKIILVSVNAFYQRNDINCDVKERRIVGLFLHTIQHFLVVYRGT